MSSLRQVLGDARNALSLLADIQRKAIESIDAALRALESDRTGSAERYVSPLLEIKEVGRVLKLSAPSIYRLIEVGDLKGFWPSPGRVYVHKEDLAAFIAKRRGYGAVKSAEG